MIRLLVSGAWLVAACGEPSPEPADPYLDGEPFVVTIASLEDMRAPGVGTALLVELALEGDRVDARITPTFGDTGTMSGTLAGDRLRLEVADPVAAIRAGASYSWEVRFLQVHALELDVMSAADGRLSFGPDVRVEGDQWIYEGDTLRYVDIAGTATIGPDEIVPEVRLESRIFGTMYTAPRPGPTAGIAYALAPWQPVVVRFSKPLRAADIEPAVTVTRDGVAEIVAAPADPEALVTTYAIAPDGWWSSATALELSIDEIVDRSGHTLARFDLPLVAASYADAPSLWGMVEVPAAAECGVEDDCVAFRAGGCDGYGGVIAEAGATSELRILVDAGETGYGHATADGQFAMPGEEPSDLTPDSFGWGIAAGTDSGWMPLVAPEGSVFRIEGNAVDCTAPIGAAPAATFVVRRR